MLLAIDIGNTNLVIGCFRNDEIVFKAPKERSLSPSRRSQDHQGPPVSYTHLRAHET